MIDIAIHESGNGGEFHLNGNDIATTDSLFNQVYIALFGGNIEASTTGEELEGEQREDFWANRVLGLDFNSETERLLNSVVLTSSSRSAIENAVKNDLKYMSDMAIVNIDVVITSENRLNIIVYLDQPGSQINQAFKFIWDATKREIIESIIL